MAKHKKELAIASAILYPLGTLLHEILAQVSFAFDLRKA